MGLRTSERPCATIQKIFADLHIWNMTTRLMYPESKSDEEELDNVNEVPNTVTNSLPSPHNKTSPEGTPPR